MSIEGGCFCGNIRYAADDGDYIRANCHCTMCWGTSAAPYVAWMMVPNDKFRYTRGEPKTLDSSDKGKRYFCPDCGTHLACITTHRPDIVDITIGSLDSPADYPPTLQVWHDTRLPWVHDGTPEYEGE